MGPAQTTRRGRLPLARETRLRLHHADQDWLVARARPMLRIGRGEANDLVIDDELVSRQHADIEHRNGQLYLTDRSSNGTLVVRPSGGTLYLHGESTVLDGHGGIHLGHPESAELRFVVELLAHDGKSWEATDSSPSPLDEAVPRDRNVFRKEGDYWTLAYEGTIVRLSDAKGLRYIAHLLRHPGQELHVLDLVPVASDVPPPRTPEPTRAARAEASLSVGSEDAGPMLDAEAKAAYKRRVAELKEELEEAESFNDTGRAARAREEMEFIATQLAQAVGLGGRDRAAASNAERARVMVTLRVKDELKKLRQCHPMLGSHLTSTIKTGRFCSYQPELAHQVSWVF